MILLGILTLEREYGVSKVLTVVNPECRQLVASKNCANSQYEQTIEITGETLARLSMRQNCHCIGLRRTKLGHFFGGSYIEYRIRRANGLMVERTTSDRYDGPCRIYVENKNRAVRRGALGSFF